MAEAGRKLGFALGSGGARGFAHAGVLRFLLEKGVAPAVVTGTSMGAVVGAALAAGSFDRMLKVLGSLDMGEAASLFLDFSFSKSGLVKGRRVMEFLGAVIPDTTFDKLSMPFAAMATDVSTGRVVTLSRGKVLPAIRASISIPGVFTPVRRGDALLVDGGISSPVPVEAARALGATEVLAVNVDGGEPCPYCSHRLPKVVNQAIDFRERLRGKIREGLGIQGGRGLGIVDLLSKTTRICEDRIAKWEVERTRPEWLVEPAVGDIPTLDFSRIDDAVRAGYEAAEKFYGGNREALARGFAR